MGYGMGPGDEMVDRGRLRRSRQLESWNARVLEADPWPASGRFRVKDPTNRTKQSALCSGLVALMLANTDERRGTM